MRRRLYAGIAHSALNLAPLLRGEVQRVGAKRRPMMNSAKASGEGLFLCRIRWLATSSRGTLILRDAWNRRPTTAVKPANPFRRYRVMKTLFALFILAALAAASIAPANAKGCLKGAAVGGVAGHYAGHHGVIGALAGCAYGRHRAKEQARQQQGQTPAGQEKL
jgi:hypothetical protein